MFGFVLNLAILSIMFSLIGAAAILYRRFVMRSREGMMYPVWIMLLVISILPLRISLSASPQATAEPSLEPQQSAAAYESDYSELELAELIHSQGEPSEPDDLHAGGDTLLVHLRRLIAGLSARLELISVLLFVIWLAGAVIKFILSIAEYLQAKKLLELSSEECRSRRMTRVLESCKTDIGIERRITLRMVEGDLICSPCVCGWLRPTLFLEPGCRKLDEVELRYVMAHELCHIRRGDMLLKLFSLFVTSIHWFNPISKRVLNCLYEDCELACDRSVIAAYGKEISGVYMNTILDFAERYSCSNRILGTEALNGGLFMSRPSGVSFLKRRYANMKSYRKDRIAITATALFTLCCAAANLFALSSCTGITPGYLGSAMELSTPVEEMLRAHYGLSEDDFITPDLVDKITSLEIKANEIRSGHILADFTVNGEAGFAKAVPAFALENYWDNCIQPKIDKAVAVADETSYYNEDGKLITANFGDKLMAFYALKDPYDSQLTQRAVEEMKLTYPVILEKGSLYIFDPFASERELMAIYDCWDKAGLLDAWAIDAEVFDASSLAYFTNLREVVFDGFKPVNYDFPSTVKVTVRDGGSEQVLTSESNHDAVIVAPETYSYAVPTDGSVVTIPKNRSLEAALREYYVMSNYNFEKTPLTSRHMEKITSVKAEIEPTLTVKLRELSDGLLDSACFIRYTVNGYALPLIPQYYNKIDFEALQNGVLSDEQLLAKLNECYRFSDEFGCYVLRADVSDADESYLFEELAKTAITRIALIGKHDCGAYITQFQSSAQIMGLAPRLLDCIDSLDEADKALFPNLTDWSVPVE